MVSMLTGNEAIVSRLSSMEGIILILRVVCGSEPNDCYSAAADAENRNVR